MGRQAATITLTAYLRGEENDEWATWAKLIDAIDQLTQRPEYAELDLMVDAEDYYTPQSWTRHHPASPDTRED